VYEQAADLVAADRIVLAKGRIDLRGRELQVVASEIRELAEREAGGGKMQVDPRANGDPLLLSVPTAECTNGLVNRLKQTLAAHPGEIPVVLTLLSEGARDKTLRLSDGYRVDASAGLLAELRSLLGSGGVSPGAD
jgi:DNA polymerase-3 subunit alpha